MGRIVVGVDGSDTSVAALRWAMQEGQLRACEVEAIYAWTIPVMYGPMGAIATPPPRADMLEAVQAELSKAIVTAGGVGQVTERIVEAPAAQALVEASQDADMLVVGSRGLGGFRGLLLGSIGQQCAHHAGCPVVIIPHERGS